MEVEEHQTKLMATLELIDEGVERFLSRLIVRVSKVDQVAVVGEDLLRGEARGGHVRLKVCDGFCGQRFGMPPALVFCKERESLRADGFGVKWGVLNSACGADMCSNQFHGCLSVQVNLRNGLKTSLAALGPTPPYMPVVVRVVESRHKRLHCIMGLDNVSSHRQKTGQTSIL